MRPGTAGRGPATGVRPSPLRLILAIVGGLWLAVGFAAAATYVNSYAQYRGFARPTDPRGVPAGRVVTQTFFSTALGRQASYLVYLPPDYVRSAGQGSRFPVLYLLHGSPGYPESFLKIAGLGVRLDVLVHSHRIAPMLLVMPDGRVGHDTFSDSEWANGTRGRYGDFVINVVADVDRRLSTVAARTGRVLAGYSEGGYGAINVGLHNLATFAGIEAWSGYYVEGRSGTFGHTSGPVLRANSPLDYAASLGAQVARYPVRVFLYTGRGDPILTQMAPLVAELQAAGAQAASAVYRGAHDWSLWRAHADQMLALADQDFKLRPRASRRSPGAVNRALQSGAAIAAQVLEAERRAAIVHDRQVAVCRAAVAIVTRGTRAELASLSPHGFAVVEHHLVRNCLIAPPRQPVTVTLCERLPFTIAIERRSALRVRGALTARCLRAVSVGRSRG